MFRKTIDLIIERAPDLVIIAGDVFHNVRPSNPAILTAFQHFSRLRQSLPDTIVVMLAGNHDTPRSVETGCILRLFAPLGIEVVDSVERRLTFVEHSLAVLAIPGLAGSMVALEPDPAFKYNILALHGEIAGELNPVGPIWRAIPFPATRPPGGRDGRNHGYETTLSRRFMTGVAAAPGLRLWGITDIGRIAERTPTLSTSAARSPRKMARNPRLGWASSAGTATSMRRPSSSGWVWPRLAVSSALAWSTTTPRRRSTCSDPRGVGGHHPTCLNYSGLRRPGRAQAAEAAPWRGARARRMSRGRRRARSRSTCGCG